jgi:hypothetical protein
MDFILAALGAAGGVGLPMLGWVLRLQGRITALETWREIYEDHSERFQARILQVLDRIENKLDSKVDR